MLKLSPRCLTLLIFCLISFSLKAQDEKVEADTTKGPWELGGKGSLSFSQVTLQNWAAGGQNSISLNSFLGLSADYEKGKTSWDNRLEMAYGFLQQGIKKTFVKSDDKIDLASKFGHDIWNKKWYLSAQTNFKTQFDDGFSSPEDTTRISTFMAPGYLVTSMGLEYKPKKWLKFLFSPVTNKMTLVLDKKLAAKGAFGVDSARQIRMEMGGYITAEFKKEIVKNVMWESRLNLFSNYLENPENIDVSWENNIVMKINKYMTATFINQILYDHDILVPIYEVKGGEQVQIGEGQRIQYKQVLGLGLTYVF